jgi:2-polyprenyl-3-methyl-5-hydroxy-6-metoxy-1,4-benzoquinol methylase
MPKRNVAEFFDSYAQDFNAIYGNKNTVVNNIINKLFRKSMRERYLKTIAGCDPIEGRSIIDIGCGPGHYAVSLASGGAGHVCGIDFAESMIELSEKNAERAGVSSSCSFILGNFMTFETERMYDYSIVMGFMDYVEDPKALIDKVISITVSKAFFSFPSDSGLLAWQRKIRYKKRCDLFMYNASSLYELFSPVQCKNVLIEKISRDYFTTVIIK